MHRTLIDFRKFSGLSFYEPCDPAALEFIVDDAAVALVREALAKRKYAQTMEDATFPSGAILDSEV